MCGRKARDVATVVNLTVAVCTQRFVSLQANAQDYINVHLDLHTITIERRLGSECAHLVLVCNNAHKPSYWH